MDLSQLQAAQAQLAQRNQSRSQQGDESYRLGLAALDAYERAPSHDSLLTAMQHFIDCMGQQRHRVEPLIALAGIYHAIGAPQSAVKYFRLADALEPRSEMVAQLRELLSQTRRVATIAEARAQQEGPLKVLDYDALYSEVETLIQEVVQRIAGYRPPGPPSPSRDYSQSYASHRADLEALYAALRSELATLHAEFDVNPLQLRLRPFERYLHTLGTWLAASEAFADTADRIAAQQALVQRALENPPAYEAQLERLLDSCDQIADRLDALEAGGHETLALIKAYERLITQVTAFQDALDS